MKILFCNYEYPPLGGGGGVVMAALARQLARRHEVTVLTSRAQDLPADSEEAGVRVLRVPVWFRRQRAVANFPSMLAYLPSATVKGYALLRKHPFDVINTHFVVPTGPVGHCLSRLYGIPNVLSVHGGDLYDPSKLLSPHRHAPLRSLVRGLLGRADVIVGQSQDTLRRVRDLYRVARSAECVPLGIERPRLSAPALRGEFGLPQEAFVLITVGRLVARKNTAALLHMLYSPELRDVHLAVVGDGPQAQSLQRLAHELGMASRVHLLGELTEAAKYRALCVANAFVSASRHEGFGIVFLEAMACGLPVICYDRGGQTDFLQSARSGYVVPLDDVRGLTTAVVKVRDDLALRCAMSRHNLTLVEQFFIDTCAARYEEIFAAAIDPLARNAHFPPRIRAA